MDKERSNTEKRNKARANVIIELAHTSDYINGRGRNPDAIDVITEAAGDFGAKIAKIDQEKEKKSS